MTLLKSLVYDLFAGPGVVISRAASILRSVETLPVIGRFDRPFSKILLLFFFGLRKFLNSGLVKIFKFFWTCNFFRKILDL